MRNMSIKIIGNESVLTYNHALLGIFQATIKKPNYHWSSALNDAYIALRQKVASERSSLRDADKLAEKPSNSIFDLLRRKRYVNARKAFEGKSPINHAKHVGVEIEFISNSSQEDIAASLAEANLTQYVQLKHDASVKDDSGNNECDGSCRDNCECAFCGEDHFCDDEDECRQRCRHYERHNEIFWEINEECAKCPEETYTELDEDGNEIEITKVICLGHCKGHRCNGYDDHNDYDCNCECDCNVSRGHEIAIVAKSKDISTIVSKVCAVLHSHDAKVNSTCGLHVHVDMRKVKNYKKCFANLVKSQKLLYSMVPSSRRNNYYCAPNKSIKMTDHSGRYWGINPASYSEHKTIEVRIHSGTVSATKINHWIKLLTTIAYAKSIKEVHSLADLTNKVKLSKDLMSYIIERVNKFNPTFITLAA